MERQEFINSGEITRISSVIWGELLDSVMELEYDDGEMAGFILQKGDDISSQILVKTGESYEHGISWSVEIAAEKLSVFLGEGYEIKTFVHNHPARSRVIYSHPDVGLPVGYHVGPSSSDLRYEKWVELSDILGINITWDYIIFSYDGEDIFINAYDQIETDYRTITDVTVDFPEPLAPREEEDTIKDDEILDIGFSINIPGIFYDNPKPYIDNNIIRMKDLCIVENTEEVFLKNALIDK